MIEIYVIGKLYLLPKFSLRGWIKEKIGNEIIMKIITGLLLLQVSIMASQGTMIGLTTEIVKLDVILNGKKTGSVDLPVGREVEIINQTSTKYKIRSNGLAEGWVEKDALEVKVQETALAGGVSEKTTTKSSPAQNKELELSNNEVTKEEQIIPDDTEIVTHNPSGSEINRSKKCIVKPGELVFLELPFETQARSGLCASSSLLNIINYHGPLFRVDQEEMFKLLGTGGKAGATWNEMRIGTKNMNFEMRFVYYNSSETPREDRKNLPEKVISLLNEGKPLSVATQSHALVLVGYNMETKDFYVWDQSKPSRTAKIPEVPWAPKGTYTVPMNRIAREFETIDAVIPGILPGNKLEKGYLKEKLGIRGGIEYHRFYYDDRAPRKELEKFAEMAAPIMIGNLLKAGRKIAIPLTYTETPFNSVRVEGDFIMIPEMNSDKTVIAKMLPSEEEITLKMDKVVKYILDNGNRFYSY